MMVTTVLQRDWQGFRHKLLSQLIYTQLLYMNIRCLLRMTRVAVNCCLCFAFFSPIPCIRRGRIRYGWNFMYQALTKRQATCNSHFGLKPSISMIFSSQQVGLNLKTRPEQRRPRVDESQIQRGCAPMALWDGLCKIPGPGGTAYIAAGYRLHHACQGGSGEKNRSGREN
eukprot:645190-Pelagomonas_calceolata.AAC.3